MACIFPSGKLRVNKFQNYRDIRGNALKAVVKFIWKLGRYELSPPHDDLQKIA